MVQARFISNSREELEVFIQHLKANSVTVSEVNIKRSNNPKYSNENWLCYLNAEITE
jgi:hypothetical protein